jgi:hypothetical protein
MSIESVDDGLTPFQRKLSDAFFNWQARGYKNAWASLEDAMKEKQPASSVTTVNYKQCKFPCTRWCYKEGNDLQAVCDDCGTPMPGKQPSQDADVVEEMLTAYWGNDYALYAQKGKLRMTAALKIARRGYVPEADKEHWRTLACDALERLREVKQELATLKAEPRYTEEQLEDAICDEAESRGDTTAHVPDILARLTRNRTKQEKVEAILVRHNSNWDIDNIRKQVAAEIIGALESEAKQ